MPGESPITEAVLPGGQSLRIRPVQEADAAELYALEAALTRDGRGQVRTFSDLPDPGRFADQMLGRITSIVVYLAAELDGRVVASGTVRRLGPSMLDHVGDYGIGVHPDAQGLGVGRRLSAALVEAAGQVGIERLQLYTRADNPRAIALYTSQGFVVEGVRERFVRLPDGTYVDDISMVRWLE